MSFHRLELQFCRCPPVPQIAVLSACTQHLVQGTPPVFPINTKHSPVRVTVLSHSISKPLWIFPWLQFIKVKYMGIIREPKLSEHSFFCQELITQISLSFQQCKSLQHILYLCVLNILHSWVIFDSWFFCYNVWGNHPKWLAALWISSCDTAATKRGYRIILGRGKQ